MRQTVSGRGSILEEKIREILERYPFEVLRLYRGRGAYLCETGQGLKMIREYQGSPSRLVLEGMVKTELISKGFVYIDMFEANKDGEYMTVDAEGKTYVVTRWFEGRECGTKDWEDMQAAAGCLASLHSCMGRTTWDQQLISAVQGENLFSEMEKRKRELNRIRNYILKKKQKNDFDRRYMEVYPQAERQADKALQQMDEAGYEKLYQKAIQARTFCHGDYTQHNILMSKKYTAIVRFDRMRLDLQVSDLYLFLRKMMEKNRWNKELGKSILDAYDRIRPMKKAEVRCLLAMLTFPEKIWKTGNRYMNTRKSWLSFRNMEKLEKAAGQEKERLRFLDFLEKYCQKFV